MCQDAGKKRLPSYEGETFSEMKLSRLFIFSYILYILKKIKVLAWKPSPPHAFHFFLPVPTN